MLDAGFAFIQRYFDVTDARQILNRVGHETHALLVFHAADFDNDGWKDLYIANGFLRDFHVDESETYHKLRRAVRIEDSTVYYEVKKELPTYVLDHPNYIFKNNGDLTFKDMRDEWGIYYPSITYGGGYADLDNDGDMDIVHQT